LSAVLSAEGLETIDTIDPYGEVLSAVLSAEWLEVIDTVQLIDHEYFAAPTGLGAAHALFQKLSETSPFIVT
jgi:hypothetical protein